MIIQLILIAIAILLPPQCLQVVGSPIIPGLMPERRSWVPTSYQQVTPYYAENQDYGFNSSPDSHLPPYTGTSETPCVTMDPNHGFDDWLHNDQSNEMTSGTQPWKHSKSAGKVEFERQKAPSSYDVTGTAYTNTGRDDQSNEFIDPRMDSLSRYNQPHYPLGSENTGFAHRQTDPRDYNMRQGSKFNNPSWNAQGNFDTESWKNGIPTVHKNNYPGSEEHGTERFISDYLSQLNGNQEAYTPPAIESRTYNEEASGSQGVDFGGYGKKFDGMSNYGWGNDGSQSYHPYPSPSQSSEYNSHLSPRQDTSRKQIRVDGLTDTAISRDRWSDLPLNNRHGQSANQYGGFPRGINNDVGSKDYDYRHPRYPHDFEDGGRLYEPEKELETQTNNNLQRHSGMYDLYGSPHHKPFSGTYLNSDVKAKSPFSHIRRMIPQLEAYLRI
ncbi:uncharacterized protein LOC106636472 [Copidosoma floridanum]|uniref:uncharacterized protein LOC106636472 n=1 Tax=Copidosoma floridanum TaxID=29053 RepID=UPI0006C9D9C6|nr:uncharacterized protein LOC106636472 [Copidosoma floridanum]